ncbi:MAG TPA: monovalent cation/H+ antiporter subunit D family protein [Afifellaceae bacterium]|nr:monovalent cation/H+ antiporter subunit D family protein [Afifellaceae bacterium]
MNLAEQLPALQVVAPLFAAVLCALVRRGQAAWLVALLVSLAMPFIAAAMLIQVWNGGPISYAMGGWAPPYGIEYRVDLLSGFVLLLVSFTAAVMLPFAHRSVASEVPEDRQAWFYTVYLLTLTGLLGITITGDAFNAFVFLEISSLGSYAMIAMGRNRCALIASYRYLVLGTVGATFYVIGVALLYLMTGTLNFADMADRLADVDSIRPLVAALAFLTVGISLKFALFPLHGWLPDAYAFAPSFATAFLAATATKAAIYLIVRYFYSIYGFGFAIDIDIEPLAGVLIALSVMAMFAASFVAIFQDDIKRMLAYSSVAQIGYITLGIGLANEAGLTGGIVHLFNHALMKGALFLAVGAVVYRVGACRFRDFAGLGRAMPLTLAAFVVAGLSLIGVPGTAGFISKWYLAVGALDKGWWWMVLLLVASSLISVVYIGRVVEAAYFREPVAAIDARAVPLAMLVPVWLFAAANLYFGIDTTWSAQIAGRAAAALLGGAP